MYNLTCLVDGNTGRKKERRPVRPREERTNRHGTRNEVLTPFGWQLAVFLLGASGWQLIVRMTQPVAIDPDWPA